MLPDRILPYAEQADLRIVRVGHKALPEHGGASGDRNDPVCEQAARETFRGGDRLSALFQQPDDEFGDGFSLRDIDAVAQAFPEDVPRRPRGCGSLCLIL